MIKNKFIIISLVFSLVLSFTVFAFADDEEVKEIPVEQTVETEVLRVTPQQTNGFHSVVLTLIGDYNPIAVTTAYQYPAGTGYQTRYQVDVEPDWSWICCAGIFTVVLFCVFRFIGGIFKHE